MKRNLWGCVLVGALSIFMQACATDMDENGAATDSIDEVTSSLETMTDRCSGDVAIVPYYDAKPETPGAVILERDATGNTAWTPPFNVSPNGDGRIRWWCHSTTGNLFDPGTWRINEFYIGEKCDLDANNNPINCHPDIRVSVGSSAWQGWTAERSRCDSHTGHIRARLGNNRLLQIQCLQ